MFKLSSRARLLIRVILVPIILVGSAHYSALMYLAYETTHSTKLLTPVMQQEYDKYRQLFDATCGENSSWVSVRMKPLPPGILAYCYSPPPLALDNSSAFIIINEDKWSRLSHTRKKLLIWHELGHCVLNRHHTEYRYGVSPNSIMTPYVDIELELVYLNNPAHYEAELCTRE